MRRRLLVALPLLLAGCGTLPQPLLGKPGAMGARLAVPPPPVLIVPPPPDALLGNRAADAYAHDLAKALVDRNVPSIVRPARPYDWQLEATARTANATVIPGFRIIGPGHKEYGHLTGAEVSGAAWAAGDPATLRQAADAAAPGLVKQLSAINAAVQQSNPASLENRPPRVRLIRVTGAPGDGNHALKLDVSRDLPKLGVVMVDHTADADFLIDGVVKVSPANKDGKPGGSDLVELEAERNDTLLGRRCRRRGQSGGARPAAGHSQRDTQARCLTETPQDGAGTSHTGATALTVKASSRAPAASIVAVPSVQRNQPSPACSGP
jgi:hypothetical protein